MTAEPATLRLGLLGVGAMGSALVRGWIAKGVVTPAQLQLFDPETDRAAALAAAHGASVAADARAAARDAEVLVVAVKPAQVTAALEAAAPAPDCLVVSIAAGFTLDTLHTAAPGCRVVRVMPNTAALVGQAASAYACGPRVTVDDRAIIVRLLGAVGTAVEVAEPALDAVTGLSGSGPAYVYMLIEALADAGVREGLPRETALALAAQTVRGAGTMVIETGDNPAILRERVCSPAGTTIAGVAQLEAHGFRAAVLAAVQAATARSKELGRPPAA